MKRTLAALGALALGATAGALGAGTFALWSAQDSTTASVTRGYVHFAVGDPSADPAALSAIQAPGETVSWTTPAGLLAPLAAGGTVVAPIQVDGQSQGNRGLSFALAGATVEGDRAYLDSLTTTIVRVADPAACTPEALLAAAEADTVFSGRMSEASTTQLELVSSAYSDVPWTSPERAYLCLGLTDARAGGGSYTNTVTVEGTATSGRGEASPLTASDAWSATIEYPDSAREAEITLEFGYRTFRGAFAQGG